MATPAARHLLRARDLIDARYAEPLDLVALARRAHVSRAHFARSFKRTFGETPHRYLLTRRMERAAYLLRHTDMSVTEVCLAVGLRSVGSFSSTFKRVVGQSPTAYRRTWRAQPGTLAAEAAIPSCMIRDWVRPGRRARTEKPPRHGRGSVAA